MDPKASAKSKRNHSHQGRKNHPTPAATSAQKKKPAPAAVAAAAAGAGEVATPRRAHARSRDLPSNWDRYDDDGDGDDSGDGAESSAGAKRADGEIRPKSKGADFRFLVEQARSQPQDHRDPGTSQSAFSLDELPSDYIQGISSMLSVRGESLLSWCADDNFIVDDDSTSSCEVNLLSMDLHALAAQLSKLKLSQRLFIEEDLLPEELIFEQSETPTMSEHKDSLSQGRFHGNSELEKSVDGQIDHWNSCNVHGITREAVVEKCQTQSPTGQATKFDLSNDSIPAGLSGRREVQGSVSQLSKHTVADLKQNRTSRFEAAAAEEELDVLFSSFSETRLSSSHSDGITNDASTSHNATFNSSVHMSPPSVGQDLNSSGNAGTSLADAIDDLLAETSLSLNDQNTVCPPNEGGLPPTNLSCRSLLGSEAPGNSSSSKQVAGVATLDSAIDDLLAETSFCIEEQKQMTCPEEQGTTSSIHIPSHSPSDSKPVDDFDSWFDTL
ncbi:uncharacterized protein [Elaeis guineensis]|uniref:uncharacterized protein isoform X2 n=1 Tax=Elaeis guineensis var. tenera TaxID=51953 RepID=UPI00057ADF8E